MPLPASLQKLKVYVVNLDRRPDRWAEVTETLAKAGFTHIERVSAVDGKRIDTDHLKKLVHASVYPALGQVRQRHEDIGSLGAVGCYLSHYKVWSLIAERNEPALVVEDDLVMHPSFQQFQLAQDPSPLNRYDFALLAAYIREPHLLTKLPDGSMRQGLHPYHGLFFSTHLYYLTPQGASFFLEGALPMQYQVDSYMGFKLKQYPEFRSGSTYPTWVRSPTPRRTSKRR